MSLTHKTLTQKPQLQSNNKNLFVHILTLNTETSFQINSKVSKNQNNKLYARYKSRQAAEFWLKQANQRRSIRSVNKIIGEIMKKCQGQ
jgi:hypothetical protein